MSKQIIQIEELIYKRMPKVSVQKWLAMLKEQFSVDESYGLLLDDYLLQEQTDNYYIDGHLVDSERIVYNINHSYHITRQPKPTISEEDTWEDSRLRFDASNHRYIVHNIHYLCEDEITSADQLCEADMPIVGVAKQAHPETSHKTEVAKSKVHEEVFHPFTNKHESISRKPWRQKTLKTLKQLYYSGYNATEIMQEMNCLESSLYYQLEHSLHIVNPFNEPKWKPRRKTPVFEQPEVEKKKNPTTLSYYHQGQKIKHHLFGDCIVERDDSTALIVIDKLGKRRVLKK